MTLLASRSAGGFIFTALFMVGACKSSNPTNEEIDRLIDARLAKLGLAPVPSASSSSSAPPVSSKPPSASAKNTNDDPPGASLAFLARLDDLMKDYTPQLPAVDDKSDVLRCVTSDAAKNSPDLQKVASVLKKKADAAKQERKRKESEFYNSIYPLAFHYDLDWQTRKGPAVPPTLACFSEDGAENGFYDGKHHPDYCSMAPKGWAVRPISPGHAPWFVYGNAETPPTQPPELMRRMETASINPPARFSCRVNDVVTEQDRKAIKCVSSGMAVSLCVSGEVKAVNAGDLVSVPLAATKRDPDGVLFKNIFVKNGGWVVDADGASMTVDVAASCPSMEEILATLGKPGAK